MTEIVAVLPSIVGVTVNLPWLPSTTPLPSARVTPLSGKSSLAWPQYCSCQLAGSVTNVEPVPRVSVKTMVLFVWPSTVTPSSCLAM